MDVYVSVCMRVYVYTPFTPPNAKRPFGVDLAGAYFSVVNVIYILVAPLVLTPLPSASLCAFCAFCDSDKEADGTQRGNATMSDIATLTPTYKQLCISCPILCSEVSQLCFSVQYLPILLMNQLAYILLNVGYNYVM